METLPSYQAATTRIDWLAVVAPYVRFADYYALCLVDHRSWRIFAPRLWVNILRAVRRRGLNPSDGKWLTWSHPKAFALFYTFQCG